MRHVVAFSGGKDSTAMLIRLLYSGLQPTVIYTPTGDELPEVEEHIVGIERRFSICVTRIGFNGGLHRLVRQERMLPNYRARFCTRLLKIQPFYQWIEQHRPATVYVGLRADEEGRAGIESEWDDVTIRYPLRECGWDLQDVLESLAMQQIVVPNRTDCARCFYQTLHEWYRLWLDYPEIYTDAEEDERLIGHTYRSPARDSHPAALCDLRREFEAGYVPKPRRRKEGCRYCTL